MFKINTYICIVYYININLITLLKFYNEKRQNFG